MVGTAETIRPAVTPANKPDDVPNSRKPKSRPPTGLREKFLRTPLPFYSGPYSVGFLDIEVPVRQVRVFSDIKRNHKHLLQLDTVLFSVFYPSEFGSGDGPSPEGGKKWSRATWLPRPRVDVAKGYGKFAGMPQIGAAAWFGITTMFTKLPAFRNAKLAEHWPPDTNAREAPNGYHVKNMAGEIPPGEQENPVFPLLIFSHGLGGTRTTYSSVCGEFASYGFVVVAIEHRDGSGPRTYINLQPPNEKEDSSTETLRTRQEQRRVAKKARGHDCKRMDYVFPRCNRFDTLPGNKQGVDGKLRRAQIELRLAEIEEAYHIMQLIHNGEGDVVARQNLRRRGNPGSSSRGLDGIKWASWKSRFHVKQVTMLGHSFGAATTVEVLRHQDRFDYIGQGIIYDIWGAAIQPPEEQPEHRINTPLLGINSEAFMYWPNNFESVTKLCKEAKEHDALCWLMTVRGSVHISQSDFSILYPKISSLLLKMTVNPQRAIDLNVNASLEFLKLVMPERISAMNRGTNEHLLEVRKLDKLPEDHKPDEKWTAMRLRIPHELTLRLTPQWARRNARRKEKGAVSKLPRDPAGKFLVGLEDLEPGQEIWMHVAPTKDELKKHGISLQEELEDEGNSHQGGIVDNSGWEGRHDKQHRGLEQRVMERA